MTVSDERTPLLSHVVLVAPGEVAAVPEALVVTAALPPDPWKGLTNRELVVLARDPFWVRLRTLAFCTFWMCWLVLFAAAMVVVATSPPCPDVPCDNTTLPANTSETTEAQIAWRTLAVPS